jgi:hypothetical protein
LLSGSLDSPQFPFLSCPLPPSGFFSPEAWTATDTPLDTGIGLAEFGRKSGEAKVPWPHLHSAIEYPPGVPHFEVPRHGSVGRPSFNARGQNGFQSYVRPLKPQRIPDGPRNPAGRFSPRIGGERIHTLRATAVTGRLTSRTARRLAASADCGSRPNSTLSRIRNIGTRSPTRVVGCLLLSGLPSRLAAQASRIAARCPHQSVFVIAFVTVRDYDHGHGFSLPAASCLLLSAFCSTSYHRPTTGLSPLPPHGMHVSTLQSRPDPSLRRPDQPK